MPFARTATAATLALLIAGAAADTRALDMPLAGKRLGMRDGIRARLVLLTRDRISAPAPGLADDPSVAGGRLEVGNPETGEWASFELPAAGWAFDNTGTRFRFRDPAPRSDTPGIQRLVLRHRKRLRLRTRGIGMTLDESRQGTIAIVLTTGSRRYCTVFGGVVTYDEPGRFSALDAPAPAACPETVTVSTTSTTTSSSTLSTEAPTTTSSAAGTSTTTSSVSSSTAESTTTTSTSTSSTTEEPTSTSSSLESSTSSSSTSTSSSSSSTAEPTTTSSSSSSSSTEEPTSTSSSTSSSSSTFEETTTTSSTIEDTTTSSTSSSSSSSSSETSTSTSSTTTSTDFTCGGVPPFACGGTCPPGETCGGLFACTCN